ncbi:TonB-dependent receptor [Membranicola marinus]|uniref:TonB-dependent receptor n=1 Tax=Membranihabitans marinus TaxID=1227546 RepID=A0A953HVT6_9BACT|nr:TonB-dependent receptor [Membranihabitans marinus]MBY5959170.1 TonB-dependent receptor [Membranihabitans marinus]
MKFILHLKSSILLLVALSSGVGILHAHETDKNPDQDEKLLIEILDEISREHQLYFTYDSDLIKGVTVNYEKREGESVRSILTRVLAEVNMDFQIFEERFVILYSKDEAGLRSLEQMISHMEAIVKDRKEAFANRRVPPIARLNSDKWTDVNRKRLVLNVTGRVMDASGEPLIGVNVQVKGTNKGTATDLDGRFSFSDIDDKAVLVVSYIGYKTQEVAVDGQTSLTIVMQEDAQTLDEVVVVGYGEVKKSDLTGSVASIGQEKVNAFPTSNVLQAISGRAAGVQVKQNSGAPGAPISVRIRGTNSIQGSNEPLYVIDGFPYSGSNPVLLSNSDIESIEVLKDASAVAIYGSRGANGVVLITTKGGSSGKSNISFESSYGSQKIRKTLNMLNANEYASFYTLQQENDGEKNYFSQDDINEFGKGFDWQNFVFKNAPIVDNSLTIDGGNENARYLISGSVFDQNGIIEGSGYKRYSVASKLDFSVTEKFTVNFSGILSRTNQLNQNSSGARFGASLISSILSSPPTLQPYNEDGTYKNLSIAYPFVSEGLTNPINYTKETINRNLANRLLLNGSLSYELLPKLVLKISGGIENTDSRSDNYRSLNFVNSRGSASVSSSQFYSLLNENTLSYSNSFLNIHNLNAVGGFTYQSFNSTSLSGSGSEFLSDVTETSSLQSAGVKGIPTTGYSKSVLLSYLGRINYNYNNLYYATLSMRADGSSKYSKGQKWGYFPSFALAWRLSSESFFPKDMFISDFKLRGSWGETGSQAIGPYSTLSILNPGTTVFENSLYTTMAPGSRLPGSLRWETTKQIDIGVDIGLVSNRVELAIDYYNKQTSDLLNSVQLPSSTGYTNTIQNVGEVSNRGIELGVNTNAINTENIVWDLNGNIAFNKSEVIKLYEGQDIPGGYFDMLVITDNATLLREGLPMSIFYGYDEDGYNENGGIKYKDISNDGEINEDDKVVIGDPNPDFIYGLNSFLSIKNFDLSIFLQGTYGNDIFNVSKIDHTLNYGYGVNQLKEVLYENWNNSDSPKFPTITRNQPLRISDRLVEDGSYLRLKNVELAYNFSVPAISLEKAKVYISAQNLLTITDYSWWDPEVNSYGGSSSIAQGIDHNTYPTSKSYNVGLRITF